MKVGSFSPTKIAVNYTSLLVITQVLKGPSKFLSINGQPMPLTSTNARLCDSKLIKKTRDFSNFCGTGF